jgi:hypothetical protein
MQSDERASCFWSQKLYFATQQLGALAHGNHSHSARFSLALRLQADAAVFHF